MPDFPIVDSHVHLWDPEQFRMSWLDGNGTLDRPLPAREYREATAGQEVGAMIYLEVDLDPEYKLLEAPWVDGLAGQDARLQGIVAGAPVEDGDVVHSYLDRLATVGPRLKGVPRRITQSEPDPNFCLQGGFVRGVQLPAEYGLSFDICINARQLPATIRMVEQCPDTRFMLDHIAKPDIRGGGLDPWRDHLHELDGVPQRDVQDQRGGDRGGPGKLDGGRRPPLRRARPGGLR